MRPVFIEESHQLSSLSRCSQVGLKDRVNEVREFLSRQSHNYWMMIVRSGGAMFLFNLTGNYSSIYTKALGADNIMIG